MIDPNIKGLITFGIKKSLSDASDGKVVENEIRGKGGKNDSVSTISTDAPDTAVPIAPTSILKPNNKSEYQVTVIILYFLLLRRNQL